MSPDPVAVIERYLAVVADMDAGPEALGEARAGVDERVERLGGRVHVGHDGEVALDDGDGVGAHAGSPLEGHVRGGNLHNHSCTI